MTTLGMTAVGTPPFVRGASLYAAMVLLIIGSQLGMLFIAALYVRYGRIEDMVSPEAVLGAVSILLAILAVRIHPYRHLRDLTFLWLASFLGYAAITEVLLRPDLRLSNVSTFISIGAFYLIGRSIGRELAAGDMRIPLIRTILTIIALWYLTLIVFMIRGDLGFYGALPYSGGLARLQFTEGFRATELPIIVGFQIPVLFYVLTTPRSPAQKLAALVLLVLASALVIATASAAAIAAVGMVGFVFLFARVGMTLKALLYASVASLMLAMAAIYSFSDSIIESAESKVQDYVAGEGVRAIIYAELINDIVTQPLGIGKGRFVETNTFSSHGDPVYPHQNLLGIGAELGVPALVLFIGFCLSAFAVLIRVAWLRTSTVPRAIKMVAAVALAGFIYQQFRGMFQDTWVARETYFWLGLGIGAATWHARQRIASVARDIA